MSQKPRALIGDSERAMQLVRADTFLRGCHEANRQQPFMQRDMRALHDGAGARREFVLARGAVVPARPHRVAAEWRVHSECATMRAMPTVSPTLAFEIRAGRVLIVVSWVGQQFGGSHGLSP